MEIYFDNVYKMATAALQSPMRSISHPQTLLLLLLLLSYKETWRQKSSVIAEVVVQFP